MSKVLKMSWNKLSITHKEEVLRIHAININLAKNKWADLDPFIKCLINDFKNLKYIE